VNFPCKLIQLCLILLLSNAVESVSQMSGPAHGTVNVIISNGTDLVAVVDSMLTYTSGKHVASGDKLYQLDDTTILTIAGFYSDPGMRNMRELAVDVPQLISEVVKLPIFRFAKITRPPFESKIQSILYEVSYRLTSHLQTALVDDPNLNTEDPNLVMYLTVAGYDLDGKLKIGEITLAPRRHIYQAEYVSVPRPSLQNPAKCETAGTTMPLTKGIFGKPTSGVTIRTVGQQLFCEIVGLTEVPERLLNSPFLASGDAGIDKYAKANRDQSSLTLEDIRQLALDLENETKEDENFHQTYRVGGDPKIAILSGGHLVEAPNAPYVRVDVGTGLLQSHASSWEQTCNPLNQSWAITSPSGIFQVKLTGCRQLLDNLTFHDSEFENSTLDYEGTGLLFFASTNSIVNTRLILGNKVDLDSPKVKELICTFPWVSVTKDNNEIHIACRKTPNQ
jgi:hypothetical protein